VCGQFLGASEESDQFRCPKCKSWSKDHHLHCYCGGPGKQDHNAIQPVLNENTRGLEWQRCPNDRCGVLVTSRDGCNHMDCGYCKTSFCYICGDYAAARSGHWRSDGRCPPTGRPIKPRNNYNGYDKGDDEDHYIRDGYRNNGHRNDESRDSEYHGRNEYNGYSDDEHDSSEKNYGIEHGHHVDVENRDWADDLVDVLGPDASTQNPLEYDAKITSMYESHFKLELEATYGRLENAPRNLRTFCETLDGLVCNIEFIKKDPFGNEPTTVLGRVERAVALINFHISHNRLRQGFWEARNLARNRVTADSVLHRTEPVELFRRAFDRYMVLHAPRHISNVFSNEAWRDRHRALYIRSEDAFNGERAARRAAALASEDAENELLQHNRHGYEDDSIFS
jgi:hypothetical protein